MDKIKKLPLAPFFALLAFAFVLALGSCERQDDLPTADQNFGDDTQLRIPDNWNGHVAIYLTGDAATSIDELVGKQAATDARTAVVLLQTPLVEAGPQVALTRINSLVGAIESEYGEVAGYDLLPALEDDVVNLLVKSQIAPEGEASSPGSGLLENDVVPACAGPCQEVTSYVLTNVQGNNFSFNGCGNPAAAQNVVDQALAVCFAAEIGNLTIACEPGCDCNTTVNTPMTLTKTCFANGGSFSSGQCTLTITGAITITVDIVLSKGTCVPKPVPAPADPK